MEDFKIENLSFTYPQRDKKAVDSINLTIQKGEYVTICGKSGSGKSTLLNHFKSVLTPHGISEGEIFFGGITLKDCDMRTQSSKIGFVMQNPDNQIVTDKVWHELAFGLENLGVEQKTIRMRVAEMANYFGIEGWFHRNVSELSGGQKQLLNLASVMAMQPSVIIFDEPTSQLDPIAAADFLNTVKKINLELGTTIIITEHRLEDIFYCSDRVVVMEAGKLIANGTPRAVGELLKQSNSEMFTALPSPMQIYYGATRSLTAVNSNNTPLTVREGRSWLSSLLDGKELTVDSIDMTDEEIDTNKPALQIKEAWFRYEKDGADILKGLSMSVPRGKLFSIVGGNGAGKSTMLKAICGVHKPYSGSILVEGRDIRKYKGAELFHQNLAMLPQDPLSLFVHKTVREDLEEMLDRKLSSDTRKALIADVSALTEIEPLLDSHPFDLSGGEQQRAALAKVLLTNPKILLLDEPTKGIDSFFKQKLAGILKKLTDSSVTIVMVSHDIEFCAKHADTISMFFDNNLLTTTTPNRFFASNSFYTTAANRMSRHIFKNAITNEEVIRLCQANQQ